MDDHAFYWMEKKYYLLRVEGEGFLIMDNECVHVIEDDKIYHEIILNMLERGQKMYESIQDFQNKKAVEEEKYQEYRKGYLKMWNRISNQIHMEIEKQSNVFQCAWLIKQFHPSLEIKDIKEQLNQNRFYFVAEGCDDPIKRKKLRCLVDSLMDIGAKINLYQLGKKLEPERL